MTSRIRRVAALLFFSGACALVYQVAWFRELRLIFGASTASSAAVLAIFMGGLGLGGAKLGKRADASPNPLAMYANLEIAVACAAGATPLLVWLADTTYLGAGGSPTLGTVGASALRLLLSIVVLGPATVLMGGTLPAAARAVESEGDGPRRSVAVLYGVNTFGAVAGALLANFLLLEVLGTRLTLWVAALVNVLLGMVARGLSRQPAPAASAHEAAAEPAPSDQAGQAEAPLAFPRWLPPAASALIGGAFMLMELTWYRMLAPLLGGSSYTFGLILAVALFGIAVGGLVYARSKIRATLTAFAITCSLEALFIAIPYAVGDRLATVTVLLRPICRLGFGASVSVWTLVAAFVVLPAAIISGIQFPLVIALYGRGSKAVGRDVGVAYLANTLGSIAGSIAGGFGLLPLLGAVGAWKLVVVALAVGATVAAFVDAQTSRPPARRLTVLAMLSCAPLLLMLASGPTAFWRHAGIGAGRVDTNIENTSPGVLAAFIANQERTIRWEEEGVESSVALSQSNGFTFIVNGKADGHVLLDAPTQVMSGVLATLLHGDPHSALVVGLGTGSTAGWLGTMPAMERVDVLELEPAIVRVARDCAPVNEHVLQNPKVHIHLADAREHLRTTKERYDIIFSEPSNPYRAGISSLYTLEYYRAAADRVRAGGMFVQWIQAYEVDGWAVATAITTLHKVFPEVTVWQTMSGDLLLIARPERKPIDVERIRALLREPYARNAASWVWHTTSAEGILAHHVARSALSDLLAERGLGVVNTDDQNFLEFAFARSVGKKRSVDMDFLELGRRLGLDRPEVAGDVDWARVQEERWLFEDSENMPLSPARSPELRTGLDAVIVAYGRGQHAAALKTWKAMHRAEPTYAETMMVAESAARAGTTPEDAALVERAPLPEKDFFRALWTSRYKNPAAATDAVIRLFTAARTMPWIRPAVLRGAVTLAHDLAAADPARNIALFGALEQPFAVEAERDPRLMALAAMSLSLPDPTACASRFGPLEPAPWLRSVREQRVRCYRRTGDPRLEQAEKDLIEFLSVDTPFGASIPAPERTAEAVTPPPTASVPVEPPPAPDASTPD